MAEGAEDYSPGRAPGTRAPSLSIHAFKVFVCPVEGSVRRAPRPRRALGASRVNRLPLPSSFKGSGFLEEFLGPYRLSTTLTP